MFSPTCVWTLSGAGQDPNGSLRFSCLSETVKNHAAVTADAPVPQQRLGYVCGPRLPTADSTVPQASCLGTTAEMILGWHGREVVTNVIQQTCWNNTRTAGWQFAG